MKVFFFRFIFVIFLEIEGSQTADGWVGLGRKNLGILPFTLGKYLVSSIVIVVRVLEVIITD